MFALEEVPGDDITFPKLTWVFYKMSAAAPNGGRPFSLALCRETHAALLLLCCPLHNARAPWL